MLKLIVTLLALALTVQGIPVDNGVEGEPEIECGPESITVNFNTRNEFEGQVYVKGLFAEESCKNIDSGRQVAGIELPFDACNTRRQRSLNPKGVFVSTTVIISFHPLFVTKVDRAYKIQCFYMEADKTVSTDLEVSMLTTDFRTQFVPMPICRYELFEAGTNNIIQFATVGEAIDHRWTCDTETVDTFCMSVHSCFVDDKNGDEVRLIDDQGCGIDRYLLNNPEYPTDLTAQVEAHVFKYADRPQLYFECQISIQVKEPNEECPRPACPVPAGNGAGGANPQLGPVANRPDHLFPVGPGPYSDLEPIYGNPRLGDDLSNFRRAAAQQSRGNVRREFRRGKRSLANNAKTVGTMDVSVDMDSLEINQDSALPDSRHRANLPSFSRPVVVHQNTGYCVSPTTIMTGAILSTITIVGLVAALAFLASRRNTK